MTRKLKYTVRVGTFVGILFAATSPFQITAGLPPALFAGGQTATPGQPILHPRLKGADAARSPGGRTRKEAFAGDSIVSKTTFIFFPSVIYDVGSSGENIGESQPWIEVGDLNGDGKTDVVSLACVNGYPGCDAHNIVGVLLGNGDGTLQPAITYDSGGPYAMSLALADVNRDGRLDIVVAHCGTEFGCFGPGSVSVLLGNGDGTFQPVVTYVLREGFANSVAVADVNGDGKPDVLVANGGCHASPCSGDGTVSVLLGNGDGTFQGEATYASGGSLAASVVVADVNADAKPDLLVAHCNWGVSYCNANGSVGVLLGNGDGTFQPAVTYSSGGINATSAAVADVNSDGRPDLLVVNADSGTVGVLLGNGDGSFQAAVTYDADGEPFLYQFPYPSRPHVVRVADVNGDGKPDLVLGANGVSVLLGNGDGTFGTVVVYYPSLNQEWVAVSDLNGDGKPDVAFSDGSVGVLLNNSGAPATTISLSASGNPVLVNQTATYTATVTAQSGGTVNGVVAFMDLYYHTPPTTVPLTGNQASITSSYGLPGPVRMKAIYSGELNTAAASVSDVLTENVRGTSTTVVTTSGSPSVLGHAVTFTAKVTSTYGVIPDGDVATFADGTTPLGSSPIAGGRAVFTTSGLSTGGHTISASYQGDAKFAPSTGTVRQKVKPSPTSISLISNLNPSVYGEAITFTATVTGSGPFPPTGQVTFSSSGNTFGSATLNSSGVAVLTTSKLVAWTNPLTAVYRGDSNNLVSTSAVLNEVVQQTSSSATLKSSVNPSTVGQAITFVAKITSPTVVPRGPVIFKAGTTVLGTVQLSSGIAKLTTSTLPAGSSVVKVIYNGNSNIKGSSASVRQTVQP